MPLPGLRPLLLGVTLALTVPVFGGISPAYAAADGCAIGVASDFNGDGRADAVVGDPYATVGGLAEAGRVLVMYGDADGKVGEGARGSIQQGAGTVGGIAEAGDRFGFALATADIDCDGYTDVLVGTPYEDLSGQVDSGYAQAIYGGPAGLGAGPTSTQYTQATFGLPLGTGDQLGYAVDALEDVGQGGTPAPDAFALAIGIPGADVSGQADAGSVGFYTALDGGSVAYYATQDSDGVPGAAEAGDRFGSAVSLGYLVGSKTTVDAAVGVPDEDIGTAADAGTVTILRDLYDEAPDGGVGFDQNSAGVPGAAEAGDRFGRSVDTIQVGSTSRLAVGAPGEDIGSDSNAGAVQLFTSNAATLTPTVSLSQDTAGVSDSTETGDAFGDRVAWAGQGPGDSTTRLVVAAPKEDGGGSDTGMVQVFPVNDLDAEVTYTQATTGVPGIREAGDKFGTTISVVEGATERVLLVGVPDDVGSSTGMVDVLPFGSSAGRSWAPGVGGVPSSGAVRFGDALAGVTG